LFIGNKHNELVFPDHPDFRPNLTPAEVMQLGSFGGTYWRPIDSGVTGESLSGQWKEFPKEWFTGLNVKDKLTRSWKSYNVSVNKYGVKCGGTLDMWESSGWISTEVYIYIYISHPSYPLLKYSGVLDIYKITHLHT